jgi:hypothetical protein
VLQLIYIRFGTSEAALGILKASSFGEALVETIPAREEHTPKIWKQQAYEMFYSVIWNTEDRVGISRIPIDLLAREELWLAKLGSWTEALAVYEEKLKRDPQDFEAMVGCMQCLIASGEWQKVLELADENWVTISGLCSPSTPEHGRSGAIVSSKSQRKAVRMGAQAAWRLGQWGELEKFASELVGVGEKTQSTASPTASSVVRDSVLPAVDFDAGFFSAILHVHRREWALAANAIDAARKAMDGRLTALMAESYSRAYPSMVTAQNLSEMEEIIEFCKLQERAKVSSHRHELNRPNEDEARANLLSVWRKRLAGCRVDAEVHASILAVRSLVLGPAEEVEATLALSELSRQAQRYKFAERVLLDPLEELNADLNGETFGFGLSESLPVRVSFSGLSSTSLPLIIDRLVVGDLGTILPDYGPQHAQWSENLVNQAGGLEKYVFFVFLGVFLCLLLVLTLLVSLQNIYSIPALLRFRKASLAHRAKTRSDGPTYEPLRCRGHGGSLRGCKRYVSSRRMLA